MKKMADLCQKPIPEVKQFLNYKPKSLLTTIEEDNESFKTQKRRRKLKPH
jgi:hypothetical protein